MPGKVPRRTWARGASESGLRHIGYAMLGHSVIAAKLNSDSRLTNRPFQRSNGLSQCATGDGNVVVALACGARRRMGIK